MTDDEAGEYSEDLAAQMLGKSVAHVKLRPVDMPSEGVFLCGTAHGPKLITETIAQAQAAAARAATLLSKDSVKLSAITAKSVGSGLAFAAWMPVMPRAANSSRV